MVSVAERAKALAEAGFAVFAVRADKTPYASDGLKSASLDPFYVQETFEKYGDKAYIGIHCGMSGIVVLDLDYKTDADGNVLVDGFDSLDRAWVDVPESFSYDSLSGNGKHIMYAAPEGKHLSPKAGYRKMAGVDRRAGESYVVFTADTIPDKATFSPAPEWLCEESQARSVDAYTGTVKDWYETLETGEPNLLVRRAIEDAEKLFESRGDDLSHSDVIELQHRAVRLGAEGNPGVPALLERIEEMFMSRTGAHSRSEEEWPAEFAEGLASGIQKHGAAIDLRKNLPEYDLTKIPAGIPDRLLTGAPGNKDTFRELLATAAPLISDDLELTSLLWNSPRTKDIAREWGMIFVHERVKDYRERPEPVRENPSLAKAEPKKENTKRGQFLTAAEEKTVKNTRTFIDVYTEVTQEKGFTNFTYAPPAAWTILSMAYGYKAFIPLAKSLEVNTWFIVLGESTTGKGTEDGFLRAVLNAMFLDGESENYNLGALSSPDGLHMGLINRDGKSSIIHNDEAADFFRDIRIKDWMASVPDKLAKWYDGFVEPSSKISLKELRGKSARTSLNQLMWGTPERMLTLMDASQFDSGYLARVNWVWDKTIPDPNRKSDLKIREGQRREVPDSAYELAADLSIGSAEFPERFGMKATESAQARLNQAADDFRATGRTSPRWNFIKPAVDRLVMETLWKCSALVALYEGRTTFTYDDTLTAIHFGGQWLRTVMEVSESISESPYSRDLAEIESFVTEQGGTVTRASLLHAFRGKVLKTQREVDDKINYLIESGRLLRVSGEGKDIVYKLNV